MATILQYLVYGLQLGSVYALLALGYTMVYGIVGMINTAHGDFLMIGALGTYFIAKLFDNMSIDGTYPMLAVGCIILIAMVMTGGIASGVEAIAYRPLRNKPRMIALITAVGVSMFLENFPRALPFIGPNPRPFPTLFTPKTFNILGASVTSTQIIMIVLAAITMLALDRLVARTKIGGQMRAVSMDKDAASLMGINVNATISMTFAIGSALAAIAGVLLCSYSPVLQPTTGSMPGIKAFTAAVFGGIGSIPGAFLGGLLLGIIESMAKAYISTNLANTIVFAVLIVVLLVKPSGLLGKYVPEKV